MEYSLLFELENYVEIFNPKKSGMLINKEETLAQIIFKIQGLFYGVDCFPFTNYLLSNIKFSDTGYTFYWKPKSESAICPRCDTESHQRRNTYKYQYVVGEEILGRPVTHVIKKAEYNCAPCKANGDAVSFVEDISDICGKRRKTTWKLDEKIVNEAIYRSANGLAKDYKGRIDVSRGTILNRLKEAGAMVTTKNLTETDDVKVLSVDDNNGRKGNSSTANTVLINGETHAILAVVEGADSEKAEQLFKRFTEARQISRDRACAYSKAGNSCDLEQYADIFHLIDNAHTAAKDVLSKELPYNIYLREGDGWVELSTIGAFDNNVVEDKTDEVYVATLTDEDIDLRVKYAQLSAPQEKRYRSVIEILRLHDLGLSSKEIRKRMDLTAAQQTALYRDAPEVIDSVEQKIDECFSIENRVFRQKFMSKKPRPASKSKVAPYGETVMKMDAEGHNHREIYTAIAEMGFEGCSATVYQYLLKRRLEEAFIEGSAEADGNMPERPPKITLQRTTKSRIYKLVLREVSEQRDLIVHRENETTAPTEETTVPESSDKVSVDVDNTVTVAPTEQPDLPLSSDGAPTDIENATNAPTEEPIVPKSSDKVSVDVDNTVTVTPTEQTDLPLSFDEATTDNENAPTASMEETTLSTPFSEAPIDVENKDTAPTEQVTLSTPSDAVPLKKRKSAFYPDEIADIIFRIEREDDSKKKQK